MPWHIRIILLPLLSLILWEAGASAQTTVIKGSVADSSGIGLRDINVVIDKGLTGGFTDQSGKFELVIKTDGEDHIAAFSSIGYKTTETSFTAGTDPVILEIILSPSLEIIDDIEVLGNTGRNTPTMQMIPVKEITLFPAVSGGIENLLVSLPGVTRQNELSNRYSVRGGSYDENLVYVNDIEVYRPFLVRAGRQEGLSFINPALTGVVKFSSGGFDASYGDKMSSVLDIRYRKPDRFRGSVLGSLLENSLHVEGTLSGGKISFLTGARYKTTRLLLRSLDEEGNYKPDFVDFQNIISYSPAEDLTLSLFTTFGLNSYGFVPRSQRTSFGNLLEAYQIYVNYEGGEYDRYRSGNWALTTDYSPGENVLHKLIIQNFISDESETIDIVGSYALNALDRDLGSENLGDSIMNIGTGLWIDHARNNLNANILSFSYRGTYEIDQGSILGGIKLNIESVNDHVREWRRVDSAGYTIPWTQSGLRMTRFVSSSNRIDTRRAEGFLVYKRNFFLNNSVLGLNSGARISYWSYNRELIISPRVSLNWEGMIPGLKLWISAGRYFQPPFYRELRDPDGKLNRDIVSQQSDNYSAGAKYDFKAGTIPLLLTCELYYKDMKNIIPYKYDNVRIIYSARNNATGYVRGIDVRIFGEFVKDAESWLSLSLMEARHDISDDASGSYPAPSDTRFSANLFFQDYFPTNPTIRAHINMQFSTGVPVSSPYEDRYDNWHRMPSYRRVDIGFSKVIRDRHQMETSAAKRGIESIIAGFEVFNLLDINNTVSYHWLTTVNNLDGQVRQFAVPNYLTGRSFNVKLSCTF